MCFLVKLPGKNRLMFINNNKQLKGYVNFQLIFNSNSRIE